jgi:hypothetical protein
VPLGQTGDLRGRRLGERHPSRRAQKHCCIFARLSCNGRSPHCTSIKVYYNTSCAKHNYILDAFLCYYSLRSTAAEGKADDT